jgi:hypothetical protein
MRPGRGSADREPVVTTFYRNVGPLGIGLISTQLTPPIASILFPVIVVYRRTQREQGAGVITRTAAGDVRVRTRLPLELARRLRWITACGVVEVDLVWCSRRRWEQSPAASRPGWQVIAVGPFVAALRVSDNYRQHKRGLPSCESSNR